jgi:hypothetical protein
MLALIAGLKRLYKLERKLHVCTRRIESFLEVDLNVLEIEPASS